MISVKLFLSSSYLQRRIKCVFKNCGYPESWRGGGQSPPRGVRGAPLPPLPSAGRGGGNTSWLTADIGFHSECGLQIKNVTAIDEVPPWYQDGIRVVPGCQGHCHRREGGTRMVSEWYQGGVLYRFILDI